MQVSLPLSSQLPVISPASGVKGKNASHYLSQWVSDISVVVVTGVISNKLLLNPPRQPFASDFPHSYCGRNGLYAFKVE